MCLFAHFFLFCEQSKLVELGFYSNLLDNISTTTYGNFPISTYTVHTMHSSKLIELLKSLSTSEIRVFGKFLDASSYRKKGQITVLFGYLKKLHPDFPEQKINKDYVHKKIFAKDGSSMKRMFDVMYNLSALLEDYLIQTEFESQKNTRNFLLLEALKKRKLDKLFFQKIAQMEKEWEKEPQAGIGHLHNEYLLAQTCYMHPNYSVYPNMPLSPEALNFKIDKYYFALKLYNTLLIKHRDLYLKSKEDSQENYLIEDIYDKSASNDFAKVSQIQLLRQFWEAYQRGDYQNYQYLQNIFFESYRLYDKNEQNDLMLFLQHFCYENYRSGKQEALTDLFKLHKFGVEKEIVIENGYINTEVFRNIVHLACAVKELKWIKQFLDNYGAYLDNEKKWDVLALSQAVIDFNEGIYENVLSSLANVKFQDTSYRIQARCLCLQAYYELDEYEELFFNLVRSFSVFLERNQEITDRFKVANLKFIQYTKELQMYKFQKNGDLNELRSRIQNEAEVSNKLWLLNKLAELF